MMKSQHKTWIAVGSTDGETAEIWGLGASEEECLVDAANNAGPHGDTDGVRACTVGAEIGWVRDVVQIGVTHPDDLNVEIAKVSQLERSRALFGDLFTSPGWALGGAF